MPELSKDVVALLQYLAPGFLMAWVFFGMTSHNKPVQFERVVQALVFTVFIQVAVSIEKWGLLALGRKYFVLGPWTENIALGASIGSALALGLLVAFASNSDAVHKLLRRLKISTRSNHPSEWYQAFCADPCWVVIRLKEDGKRYMGWPSIWASDPKSGHMYLTKVQRLYDDQEPTDLIQLDGILFNVEEIQWVEFLTAVTGAHHGNSDTPTPTPTPSISTPAIQGPRECESTPTRSPATCPPESS